MDFKKYKGEVLEPPPKKRPDPSLYEVWLFVWVVILAVGAATIATYGPHFVRELINSLR